MTKNIVLVAIFILHFISQVTKVQTTATNVTDVPRNATTQPVSVQTSSGNSSVTTGSSLLQNVTSESQNQTMSILTPAVVTTASQTSSNVTMAPSTDSNNYTVTASVENAHANVTKMWTLPPEHVSNVTVVTFSVTNSTNSGAISSSMTTKTVANTTMATKSVNVTMVTKSPNVTMVTVPTHFSNSTTSTVTSRHNTTVPMNQTTSNPPIRPTTESTSNSTGSVPHSTESMLNFTTPISNSTESLKNTTDVFVNTTAPTSNSTITTPIPITNLTQMPEFNTTSSISNPADSNVTKPLIQSTIATPMANLTTVAPNVTSTPNNQTIGITPNMTQQTTLSANYSTARPQTTSLQSNSSTNTTAPTQTESPIPATNGIPGNAIPPAVTMKPLIPVNFVVIVIDDISGVVNGPTVQFSSRGINTISIPLKNSSHILHTTVNVREDESVVVMVTKPGYATNAVRVIPKENAAEIVARLAKLQPASISVVGNTTVQIETPKNENGLTATIQFPRSSTYEMENITADCLLVATENFLPDPSTASNTSESGTIALRPYAALQLNVYSGSVEVTVRNFTMLLPINEKGSKLEEGNEIPAWYFDENAGVWKKSGTGVLQKISKNLYWEFTAPHLSWWMAATEEKQVTTKKGGGLLLGNMSGTQFILILIIACVGVFGIGAMLVFVCMTPRIRKVKGRPIGQNGSTRSNQDSEAQMAGASSTENLELKDSSESFPDPPELSVGLVNKGYPESSHV